MTRAVKPPLVDRACDGVPKAVCSSSPEGQHLPSSATRDLHAPGAPCRPNGPAAGLADRTGGQHTQDSRQPLGRACRRRRARVSAPVLPRTCRAIRRDVPSPPGLWAGGAAVWGGDLAIDLREWGRCLRCRRPLPPSCVKRRNLLRCPPPPLSAVWRHGASFRLRAGGQRYRFAGATDRGPPSQPTRYRFSWENRCLC
jgi:hypothetical protein